MIRAPELDDIDFDKLVQEARALIPRFAPDWTDHNFHDPGMTLIDLIAWIADTQIYRIGFVGDRHLAAFAALMGVAPAPPAPARGLIWPAAIPAAQGIAEDRKATPADAPDMPFRVETAIQLSGTAIDAIRLVRADGTASAVRVGERIPVSGGDSLELRLEAALPVASGRFSLGVLASAEVVGEAVAGRALAVDRRLGDAAPWQQIGDAEDGTAGLLRSGLILFHAPAVRWLRLRMPAYLPAPAGIERLSLDVVPIVQREALASLELGQGNGLPDQDLPFDFTGLLPPVGDAPALDLRGDDGSRWAEQPDLETSGPTDRHFLRDVRHGAIRFGNGVNGRKPEGGLSFSLSGAMRTRGSAGNLAQGRAWTVESVAGPFGSNAVALTGGRDAQGIGEVVEAMRLRALRRDALVTDADLRGAALDLRRFGVADAEIFAGLWPARPGKRLCGARTLVVRTATGHAPDAHVAAVGAALSSGRVVGERLFVVAPVPVSITVSATIVAAGGNGAAIVAKVRDILARRLSDRAPVAESWPAGRPVTTSEIETLIAGVPQVRSIPSVRIARDGGTPAKNPIVLGPTEVASLDPARTDIRIVEGSA